MIDFYNTVALWRKLGEGGGVTDCLSKFSLVIIFYLHKQHLSRRVTCNICEIHETNSFVVRQGFFFVATRMLKIVKQYIIQRLITKSNLLLPAMIILFHILYFSFFLK